MGQNTPRLADYDIILASISGGKDSQTMLGELFWAAVRAGVEDRLVCVFADLGDEDEWPGTAELAQYHAGYYGLRFIKVQKLGKDGLPLSLHQHIVNHGKWPNNSNRFCTSDMKRDPIAKTITALCAEVRATWAPGTKRAVRVLNCMGMRAEESPARQKLQVFATNERLTGKGVAKQVDNWLPIHDWTTVQVWADIKASGVKYHWVYDAGLTRLSCRFCVLAGRKSLVRAAQIDPAGAVKRAESEELMNHTFGRDFTMRDIIAEAEAATAAGVTVQGDSYCM